MKLLKFMDDSNTRGKRRALHICNVNQMVGRMLAWVRVEFTICEDLGEDYAGGRGGWVRCEIMFWMNSSVDISEMIAVIAEISVLKCVVILGEIFSVGNFAGKFHWIWPWILETRCVSGTTRLLCYEKGLHQKVMETSTKACPR